MIINDTCATRPVSSPTEELCKDKRSSDEAGTLVCVLCAAVVREGLPLYFCLFILLLKCLNLNVHRFPPPSSRSTNFATESYIKKLHITNGLNFYSLLQDDRRLLWLQMLKWVLFRTHGTIIYGTHSRIWMRLSLLKFAVCTWPILHVSGV